MARKNAAYYHVLPAVQWLPFWAPFDAVFDTSCPGNERCAVISAPALAATAPLSCAQHKDPYLYMSSASTVARSRQVCIYWLWKHCLLTIYSTWGTSKYL